METHGRSTLSPDPQSSRPPSSEKSTRRQRTRSEQCIHSSGGKPQTRKGKDKISHKNNGRLQSASNKRLASRPKSSSTVTVVETPGYSLYRSPSHVQMNIRTNTFFGDNADIYYQGRSPLDKKSSRSSLAGPSAEELSMELESIKNSHAKLLQELKETIAEKGRERQKHEKDLEEILERCGEEKKLLRMEFEDEMSQCKENHKKEIEDLIKSHREELEAREENHLEIQAKLRAEIKVAQLLLEETKFELNKENEENLRTLEEKLTEKHKWMIEQLENKLREEFTAELARIKDEMTTKHKIEISDLNRDHKQEVEALLQQFSNIGKLEEELIKSNKTIKKLERQASKLRAELKLAQSNVTSLEAELLQTHTKLKKYQTEFQKMTKQVEQSYKSRLDSLTHENSQLRKRIFRKSEEFSQYQSSIEASSSRTIRSYEETVHMMIRARKKANLGVAMGLGEGSGGTTERPHSAPTTKGESARARKFVLSCESSMTQQQSRPRISSRPGTS